VLVSQPYSVPGKTRQLYAALTPADMSDGSATRELLDVLLQGGDITAMPLYNAFERAALQVFPGLDSVRQQMLDAGAPNIHLSGSGPTLYTLYPQATATEARRLHDAITQAGFRAYLVTSVT
jgi:4-diphosphocytidyl-2-C-methyl-D-erythritol kinase